MISGKMFYSPVFGCILENAPKKKKKKKKPHPNITGIAQKLITTIGTHRNSLHKPTVSHLASHLDPQQIKPPSKSTKNTSCNPSRPTAQNQTPNQPNPINFDPPQHLNPSPASIKSIMADLVNLKNKNPDLRACVPYLVTLCFVEDSSSCSWFVCDSWG
jgi:hypothetical protein